MVVVNSGLFSVLFDPMNTVQSVKWGWICFTAAFLGGAYVGKQRFNASHKKKLEEMKPQLEAQKQSVDTHLKRVQEWDKILAEKETAAKATAGSSSAASSTKTTKAKSATSAAAALAKTTDKS